MPDIAPLDLWMSVCVNNTWQVHQHQLLLCQLCCVVLVTAPVTGTEVALLFSVVICALTKRKLVGGIHHR